MQFVKKSLSCWVGTVALASAINVSASELASVDAQLTEEQSQLLYGYHQPASAHFDMHSLHTDAFSSDITALPLLSLRLTAATNNMKGNTLELDALYKGWTIDSNFDGVSYSSMGTSITVESPIRKALDFSHSIRSKVEDACAEKMLDKMLIDGALGFIINW
ncbi:hypothetical protein FT643_09655 [Ketobacter sp. MCCC 1A13808]|uniref:hypothetical protein n=1 Tax=Ketobacter sp. MCCC 1A13808 TaxID=2602738 RepID=UPI000F143506|nr:hypothetical protein [Ketobacter sp. MCCC 1A13808]MVF12407.1 hypothetical protein [Ketobacter sp. MCCC 1A13808]RLP55778.1 MAG: hypothetical protein D6160_05135 [Ketobacter sp.]